MASGNDINLLAIESAISGGSIALFRRNDYVNGSAGGRSVSRAEDLLPNIESLLNESEISRKDLGRIAISLGPGSYTGLRIGIATVMGLCRGLGIDHVGVPLIDAIFGCYPNEPALVALPMGRTDIFLADGGSSISKIISLEDLQQEVDRRPGIRLRAHSDLIPDLIKAYPDVVDIGTNLARFIAAAAVNLPMSTTLEPIYIQNPRFGNALPS
ncbi:MAG TPA: tRNA (adenosine(37)-N6)-threonylcarbamoyltransferase complex dimerization subunit type 1 TsaB [Pyrinomonadaceae bacterium]|nr:tRNA (adenosine(37)-N6)-threonylcarbamoyltransferase complex dimerization subunit type 1 TsaB [Pyrinomonadaceae bacterium]